MSLSLTSPWPRAGRWISRDGFWVACAWSGIALFDATQTVVLMQAAGMQHAWTQLFLFRLLYWLVWALATPSVLRLGMRIAAQQAPRWRWWRHLAACAGIGMLAAVWTTTLELALEPWLEPQTPTWRRLWIQHFLGGLLTDLILYSSTIAIGYGVRARERLMLERAERAQLNEQLVKAQLDALRRQIEPHFLFNTLNAITGLVRDQRNEAAVGMIAGLSELLRRALTDSDRHLVTLGEELAFLDKYLAIQQLRFGERLRYSLDAPDALLSARVPGLLLQPLVENAFKHGLAHRAQGGAVRVGVAMADNRLAMTVYNDGPPLRPETARAGIGLANVAERLKGLYADDFSLDLRNHADGVEVRIVLPLSGP